MSASGGLAGGLADSAHGRVRSGSRASRDGRGRRRGSGRGRSGGGLRDAGLGARLGTGLGAGGAARSRAAVAAVRLLVDSLAGPVSELDLDALGTARVVTVRILFDVLAGGGAAASVVGDLDVLIVGLEGTVGEVGQTAGPGNSAWFVALEAGDPGPKLDLSRGSREASAGLFRGEGALDGTVHGPFDTAGGPVDGVLVELARDAVDGVEPAKLVVVLIALGEDVGLNSVGVRADGLPVNLVEVVGEEHDGANDARAGGGLHLNLDATKKDVLLGADGRGLAAGIHGTDGSVRVVRDCFASHRLKGGAFALREVAANALAANSRIGGARLL